jgi:hypothetical protein
MIEGQEVMERINLPTSYWRSTNKDSFRTDMYECIFHLLSLWYNYYNDFLSKLPVDHLANCRRPLYEKHCCRKCNLLSASPPNAHSRFPLWNHLWSVFCLYHLTGVAMCVVTCVAHGDIAGCLWRTLTWDTSIPKMGVSSVSCCLTWGLRYHPACMPQDWAMDCRLQPCPGTE